MADLIFPNDVLKGSIYAQLGNQVSVNTRMFLVTATTGSFAMDDFVNAWPPFFITAFQAMISLHAQSLGVSLVKVTQTTLNEIGTTLDVLPDGAFNIVTSSGLGIVPGQKLVVFGASDKHYDGLYTVEAVSGVGPFTYSGHTKRRNTGIPLLIFNLRGYTEPSITYIAQDGTPGTGIGDPLPTQSCGLVSYQYNLSGKQGRGRNYLPFPTEDDNAADGLPTAGYMTDADTFASAWNPVSLVVTGSGVGPPTATITGCLYNPYGAIPVKIPTVVSRTIRKKWATQRRRGSEGRPNNSPF